MKNVFKEHWNKMNKTHDIPIQQKLDEVKDEVHELDEKLDTYETAGGSKKAIGTADAGPVPNSLLARQDLETSKGAIETTGKKLEQEAEKAEDAETKKEKNEIVDRIKNIQIKRQKAVLAERESETNKSFKTLWKKI